MGQVALDGFWSEDAPIEKASNLRGCAVTCQSFEEQSYVWMKVSISAVANAVHM